MPSVFQQIVWLLRQAGGAGADHVAYYIDNPREAGSDLWDWVNENKLMCFLSISGVLVIVAPVAIGFGAAGPIAGSIAAGWQASIGNVVAGSLFAILRSLSMTGVFTSIGGWMIGGGILRFLMTRNWGFTAQMLMGARIEEHRKALPTPLSRIHDLKRKLFAAFASASSSPTEIAQLLREIKDAYKEFSDHQPTASLPRASAGGADDPVDKYLALALSRLRELEARLDAALATWTSASETDIRQLMEELQEAASTVTSLQQTRPAASPITAQCEDATHPDQPTIHDSEKCEIDPASASHSEDTISQLTKDLQDANDQIAALKLQTQTPPASDALIVAAPYRRRFVHARPVCPVNGYSAVASVYKGRLAEIPGLRDRLKREGRCFRCRQPGAPHKWNQLLCCANGAKRRC